MATESPLIHDGAQTVAGADLSSSQFLVVKVTAARTVNLANTGGEAAYGILQNKPKEGEVADVGIFGVSKAVAGGSFSGSQYLMTDSSGRLIVATSTNHRVAQALEDSGGAGQIVTVAIIGQGSTVA